MRITLLLSLPVATLLGACANDSDVRREAATSVPDTVASVPDSEPHLTPDQADSAIRNFLQSTSPRIGSDTLRLHSPDYRDTTGPMVGRPVSPTMRRVLLERLGFEIRPEQDVFAIGWLPSPPSHELYLLRTPSQYTESAITLWLFNKVKRTWRGSVKLADAYGDERWSFDQQAWMREEPDSADIVFVIRRVDSQAESYAKDAPITILRDSLHAFSVSGWIRGKASQRPLPDSMRRFFPMNGIQ